MLDHLEIRASDVLASEPLYALLASPEVRVRAAGGDHPPSRRLHLAVWVASRADVDRFWCDATAAGFRDDGEPGMRPWYAHDYYGAFVLDPDGNSVEAVTSAAPGREPGRIDHLWVRAGDEPTSGVRIVFAGGAEAELDG